MNIADKTTKVQNFPRKYVARRLEYYECKIKLLPPDLTITVLFFRLYHITQSLGGQSTSCRLRHFKGQLTATTTTLT